ncbi:MAG: ParA family protein [Alphaproteobacteria bacterium]
MKTNIIAIANQKGGVGKTTTTINLATALAACKKKVLIVDLDSQGNASTGLGVEDRSGIVSSYDLLLHTEDFKNAAVSTEIPNLDIIPATMDLAGVEISLAGQVGRERKLKTSLSAYAGNYDYVLLDCPPNLGLVTLNALVASTGVLVPLQSEFYALEGLSQILTTTNRIKKYMNPELELAGVVLTMFDKRNNLAVQVAEDVRTHLGDKVFETVIPRNVRIAEAPSFGAPVIIHDHTSIGAIAYMMLAKEILNKFEKVNVKETIIPIAQDDGVFSGVAK